MNTIRILILEDDLETLSIIFKKLHLLQEELEEKSAATFSVSVLSEYTQVEEIINNNKQLNFEVVLLDRDCKAGGSFHVLDVERFGVEKVISISSIPDYNEEAKQRGVARVVHKDYQNLDQFSDKVVAEVRDMLNER